MSSVRLSQILSDLVVDIEQHVLHNCARALEMTHGDPEKALRSALAQCKYCKMKLPRTVEALEAHDEVCTGPR